MKKFKLIGKPLLGVKLLSTQKWRFGGWWGGPPHFVLPKSYFFGYLEKHVNPFWEKSFCPPRNDDLGGDWGSPLIFCCCLILFFCYLERHAKIKNHRQTPSGRKVSGRKERRRRRKRKRRIMPSLVATTSALARKPCMSTHYVRTNHHFGVC